MYTQPFFPEFTKTEKLDIINALAESSNVTKNLKDFEIANLISNIKSDLDRLEKLVSMPELKQTNPDAIQWDKCLRENTKSFILTLVSKFGYNQKISRKDKFIKEQLWQHRLTDFAQILNTLQERKFCKIESYVGDSNRIEYFSFIKP